ncbi:AraC family transcriptional regulator [Bacillus megaterium]|nr:AraC family transcriptional regulator [Priestia megaterium]
MLFNYSDHANNNLDLNLYTCGREVCSKNHSYGPAIRSGYMIHYIIRGKGIYTVKGITYSLTKGDAFLIEPNTLIYYEADKEDPWEYSWIGFNGVKAMEYISRSNISINHPVFHCQSDNRFFKTIDSMIQISSLESNKDLLLTSKLYEFLYLLNKVYPNNNQNSEVKQQKYIEEALLFIEQNYAASITIQDVAKHISIDRSYLHRLFRKYVKKSPQIYLLNLRMEKASILLKRTNYKIGVIARSVGYRDVLLFTRTYKKYNNMTPSQFRKKHKE